MWYLWSILVLPLRAMAINTHIRYCSLGWDIHRKTAITDTYNCQWFPAVLVMLTPGRLKPAYLAHFGCRYGIYKIKSCETFNHLHKRLLVYLIDFMFQETKTLAIDQAVITTSTEAIHNHCHCDFQAKAIFVAVFSCRMTADHVIYRSTIHGSSDKLTASELLTLIQDWNMTEGTFTASQFQMWVSTCQPLRIESIYQPECSAGTINPVDYGEWLQPSEFCIGCQLYESFQIHKLTFVYGLHIKKSVLGKWLILIMPIALPTLANVITVRQ